MKNTKIPCCNFCLFILSRIPARSIYPIYNNFTYLFTREGLTTPLFTSGCKYLLFVCRSCLRAIAWFSYWFDNLGLITKGNTYLCCAASSLPLWGNTDIVQANIKRNFWRRCGETSSTSTRFLITNLISSQFTLFSICLSFSSPPLHKKFPFYSLSFSFAVFSSDLFWCAI